METQTPLFMTSKDKCMCPNTDRNCQGIHHLCWAIECTRNWAIVLPNKLSPTICEAVFGESNPGEVVLICQRHYRYLKREEGITLGFRRVGTKMVPYIKDELF